MPRSHVTVLDAEPLGDIHGASFLRWLLLSGICLFGLYVAWTLGLLQRVLLTDLTQISAVILLIYLGGVVWGGWRARQLSAAHAGLARLRDDFHRHGRLDLDALRAMDWAGEYCRGLMAAGCERAALREVLEERAKGRHEAGWFLSSLLLKLGLLGTIIGFVFMLSALDALKTLTYADLPQMLGRMGSGMGISLYTTLVGLLANLALGMQNLMLDRSAERLVAGTLHFTEQEWLPTRDGDAER